MALLPRRAREVLGVLMPNEQSSLSLAELPISSLQSVDFIADLEEHFGIEFDASELLSIGELTLGALQGRLAGLEPNEVE